MKILNFAKKGKNHANPLLFKKKGREKKEESKEKGQERRQIKEEEEGKEKGSEKGKGKKKGKKSNNGKGKGEDKSSGSNQPEKPNSTRNMFLPANTKCKLDLLQVNNLRNHHQLCQLLWKHDLKHANYPHPTSENAA